MMKTIKCIGWVFAGVGIVCGGGAVLLAVVVALLWAGMATALALGYAKVDGIGFMLGYVMLIFGIIVGVGLCIENRR